MTTEWDFPGIRAVVRLPLTIGLLFSLNVSNASLSIDDLERSAHDQGQTCNTCEGRYRPIYGAKGGYSAKKEKNAESEDHGPFQSVLLIWSNLFNMLYHGNRILKKSTGHTNLSCMAYYYLSVRWPRRAA